jgi:pimeloyl-ACP methyl ester carboxylesterase
MGFLSRRLKVSAFFGLSLSVFLVHYLQPKFLYFPRQYALGEVDEVRRLCDSSGFTLIRLSYRKSREDNRFSYLMIPSSLPNTNTEISIFVLFGGNAMTALDWSDWVVDVSKFIDKHPHIAFLLVEYPGYGESDGTPSPDSMHEAAEKSFKQAGDVLKIYNLSVGEVNVLGHSIGAAVASRWVAQGSDDRKIRRLVLSAPFTSIPDMATVLFPFLPWPLAGFISRHNWNNRDFVRKIATGNHSTRMFVVHGQSDELVPASMGNELAKIGNCSLVPIPNYGHNDVLSLSKIYGLILSSP